MINTDINPTNHRHTHTLTNSHCLKAQHPFKSQPPNLQNTHSDQTLLLNGSSAQTWPEISIKSSFHHHHHHHRLRIGLLFTYAYFLSMGRSLFTISSTLERDITVYVKKESWDLTGQLSRRRLRLAYCLLDTLNISMR